MENFLTYVFWFMIGYFVIKTIATIMEVNQQIKAIRQERESIKETIEQTLKNSVIMMRLETNEDGVFAYRIGNDEFLAHGETYDKMIENLLARFPGKTALIDKGDVDLARGEQA